MIKQQKALIIVVSLYIAAQIFSDIASLRILLLAGISIDGGTLIYPVTFTLRDMVHKVSNKQTAQLLIILAGIINILMVLFFWMIAYLPADKMVGDQQEFGIVLAPVFRIVFASILAEIIAEMIDTEVYHWYTKKSEGRRQWLRVVLSNGISVPVDSIIFCIGAFWGLMPISVVVSILFSNVIIKYLMTIVSIPGIYIVKEDTGVNKEA